MAAGQLFAQLIPLDGSVVKGSRIDSCATIVHRFKRNVRCGDRDNLNCSVTIKKLIGKEELPY